MTPLFCWRLGAQGDRRPRRTLYLLASSLLRFRPIAGFELHAKGDYGTMTFVSTTQGEEPRRARGKTARYVIALAPVVANTGARTYRIPIT